MKIMDIEKNLGVGETIEWQGKSELNKMFAYSDAMYIPFSIMWLGFVCFWEYNIIIYNYPWVFHVLGIPMVIAGLYMAIGRFIFKRYKKKNSCYVITNKRVIETYIDERLGYKEKPISEIGRMVRFVEKDGVGTLVFDDINPAYIMKLNDGLEHFRRKTKKMIGFYDVKESESLYAMIQTLKDKEKEMLAENEEE